jgi:hypothetical protein
LIETNFSPSRLLPVALRGHFYFYCRSVSL